MQRETTTDSNTTRGEVSRNVRQVLGFRSLLWGIARSVPTWCTQKNWQTKKFFEDLEQNEFSAKLTHSLR
jgi:hypothetical protein